MTAKDDMKDFLRKHYACKEGYDWAIRECASMAEVWERAKPEWLVWVATREGVLNDCELRLFACWSVRQVWHLLTDERSRNAVEVAERFAHGRATQDELAAARVAAGDAAWAVAVAAARAAAGDAAWAVAAAGDAAWAVAAAGDAAWAAAGDAAWAAAGDAAWEKQAAYIRAAHKNPFSTEAVKCAT